MSASEYEAGERVEDVHFSKDAISVDLTDEQTITVPLAWCPHLPHYFSIKGQLAIKELTMETDGDLEKLIEELADQYI